MAAVISSGPAPTTTAPPAHTTTDPITYSSYKGPYRSAEAPWLPPPPTPTDLAVFPDGLKTTGQNPPIPSELRPFSAFPRRIKGPTVWRSEDYRDAPERWTHPFTPAEIEELGRAADAFIASGTPLTGITRVSRVYFFFVAR